ncbi:hypothetical protein [Oceanobacillus salinisoli]|uniref:hypothetical protein n=1 Tax=Oceanobacillus salinisoli TaxID=2678611 RepID=UPI001E3D6E1B|nr:hypothetical protein [Oceanobacillus salinisoli]
MVHYSPDKIMDICLKVMRGILYDWALHHADFSLIDKQVDLFDVMIEGLRAR